MTPESRHSKRWSQQPQTRIRTSGQLRCLLAKSTDTSGKRGRKRKVSSTSESCSLFDQQGARLQQCSPEREARAGSCCSVNPTRSTSCRQKSCSVAAVPPGGTRRLLPIPHLHPISLPAFRLPSRRFHRVKSYEVKTTLQHTNDKRDTFSLCIDYFEHQFPCHSN